VAYGSDAASQLSISITDLADDFPLRSNQRAELYAATVGLEFLAEADKINFHEDMGRPKDQSEAWIIATDSEYVVKGITEWLPKWRVCSNFSNNDFDTFLIKLIE
jgi:ribonuclease HI